MNRMRNWCLAFLFGVAVSASAWAADNSTLPVTRDGVSTEVFANKDIGGVKFPKSIPYNSSGTELFTTGNAGQVGSPASAFADGWSVTHGAKADSACGTDNGTCSQVALIKRTNQNLTTLNTTASTGTAATGSPVPMTAIFVGGNVAGNLRGWTGVNPSGSVYAQQFDLASIAGTTASLASFGVGATGAAAPANGNYLAALGSGATGGLLAGIKTCDLHAKYDASDNGSKTLVTGVSGRKVYVCGYILATGGTATKLKLREGSDADCATNGADLTPAWQLVANDKIGGKSSFWDGLVVSTNAYYVCVNADAGNAHQAEIWYTIQ